MVFLSFFILPLLIEVGGYVFFVRQITFKKLLTEIAVQVLVVALICGVIYHRNTADTETWNGRVAAKSRDRVSCEHSYPCHCRPVSCGKNCTTVHCDTCYEHPYDIDWDVATTNSERMSIARVDPQGLSEPPRWSAVKLGEPTSIPHRYENYIKASPDTLFRTQGDTKDPLPSYPDGYYDYYRLDHLVQFGASVPDAADWNKDLAEINGDIGHSKQVNVVVVLVLGHTHEWYKNLERRWIGGKKNDAVLVIGLNQDSSIGWVETMAWTDSSYFKVKLRDDVLSIGHLDRVAIMSAVREDTDKFYKRKPMADFSYLVSSIVPTTSQYMWGLLFSTLVAIGMTWFMEEEDIYDEGDETDADGWIPAMFGRKRKPRIIKQRWGDYR